MKDKKKRYSDQVIEIPLEKIITPADLVRDIENDKVGLEELAESVKENGLIEPVVVRKHYKQFELVVGHRRYKAHLIAQLRTIRAIVANVTKEEALIMRWEENEAREDISDYDRMRFIHEILTKTKMTQKEIAKKLFKTEGYISQHLFVFRGQKEILDELKEGKITFSIARELVKAPTTEIAIEMLPYCRNGNANALTVKGWIQESVNRVNTDEQKASADEEVSEIRRWHDEFTCDICATKTEKVGMVVLRSCRMCAQAIVDAGRSDK